METYSEGSKEFTLNVNFKAISHLRIVCKRETQRSSVRGILYILWLQLIVFFSTEESRSNTFVLGNVVIVLTAANCFARKSKNCLIQGSNQVHLQMPVLFSGKGQEMFGNFCNAYQSSQSCSISQHDPTLLQDVTLKCCVRLSCLVHFYFVF